MSMCLTGSQGALILANRWTPEMRGGFIKRTTV